MSRSTPLPTLVFMFESAQNALLFVDGMTEDDFLTDLKTETAVAMCLMNIGEAASKLTSRHPDVCSANSQVQWRDIVGLRNRIAHDYMSINFRAVWEMLETSLPKLLIDLQTILTAMGYNPSIGDH